MRTRADKRKHALMRIYATSAPGLGSPRPHLHWGRGSFLPHLRRDWARPAHICAGTGLVPPTLSAPGQPRPLIARPSAHQRCARAPLTEHSPLCRLRMGSRSHACPVGAKFVFIADAHLETKCHLQRALTCHCDAPLQHASANMPMQHAVVCSKGARRWLLAQAAAASMGRARRVARHFARHATVSCRLLPEEPAYHIGRAA
jgi:hypothetical protein